MDDVVWERIVHMNTRFIHRYTWIIEYLLSLASLTNHWSSIGPVIKIVLIGFHCAYTRNLLGKVPKSVYVELCCRQPRCTPPTLWLTSLTLSALRLVALCSRRGRCCRSSLSRPLREPGRRRLVRYRCLLNLSPMKCDVSFICFAHVSYHLEVYGTPKVKYFQMRVRGRKMLIWLIRYDFKVSNFSWSRVLCRLSR